MLNQFIQALKNNKITDIILVGFVDNDEGIYEFCPNLNYLYIRTDSRYIKLESVNQFSLLKFCIEDSLDFGYEVDEDMSKATSSIAEIVLDDAMALGNSIKEIVFYDLDKSQLTCAAMELNLVNGQMIFIDPSFYFGINIGGESQKKIWENNYFNIDGVIRNKILI